MFVVEILNSKVENQRMFSVFQVFSPPTSAHTWMLFVRLFYNFTSCLSLHRCIRAFFNGSENFEAASAL